MDRVPTDIGSLAYEVHGSGRRPWLILSTALATDRRLWDAQVDVLADTHRVLVYEHPGHGDSSVRSSSKPWQMRDLVDGVIALMDALSIGEAAFLGLSLGGSVGIQLALDFPHRVTWLACCCARADSPDNYVQLWKGRSTKAVANGMASIEGETLERWFAPHGQEPSANRVDLARSMIQGTDPQGYAGCAGVLSRLNSRPRLHELTIPTFFLAGASDLAIPPSVLRDLHERVPGSRFAELVGAGHLANLDRPTEFNEWLTGYVQAQQ
ncbi:MAG: alpha/beta fold hydrolase [Woeseia sp.]